MRKTKAGQELISGLEEIAAGSKRLRATALEVAEPARAWRKEQIAELRKGLFGVSQPVFASLLSVTVSTVRAWEQGQKSPSGAARRLLEIAALAPDLFARLSKEALLGPRHGHQTWATHSQVADRPIPAKSSQKRPTKPAKKRKQALARLVKGVTEKNRHDEADWGAPTGREGR